MILVAGKDGIVEMKNVNTRTNRDMIIINKGMNLRGPIALNGNNIELGYNENVEMVDKEHAISLFQKIADIV